VTNAVALRTHSGWAGLAQQKYVILNQDGGSRITTSGDIEVVGSNIIMTGAGQLTQDAGSSMNVYDVFVQGNLFVAGDNTTLGVTEAATITCLANIVADFAVGNTVISNGDIYWATGSAYGQDQQLTGNLTVLGAMDLQTATVVGQITANTFSGDGSQLTNLPAVTEFTSNITGNGHTISNVQIVDFTESINSQGNVTGTVTVDASISSVHTVSATGNITLNTTDITNFRPGQSVTVIVTHVVADVYLSSNLKFAGDSRTVSNTAGAIDSITVFNDGVNLLATLVKGYA